MMAIATPDVSNLTDVMSLSGWSETSRGPVGALWKHDATNALVGIPDGLSTERPEWIQVVSQIADAMRLSVEDLSLRIRRFRFDVVEFKASGSLWDTAVPVEAGFNLFRTARKVLRSTATTSRGTRAEIGTSYLQISKDLVSTALFDQTRHGSYVVPMLLPVEGLVDQNDDSLHTTTDRELETTSGDDVFTETVKQRETQVRRVTRTMAEALSTVESTLITPDEEPTQQEIAAMVDSGVSKELLSALYEVISAPAVLSFNTSFAWSEVLSAPNHLDGASVGIPSAAAELIKRTIPRFVRPARNDTERFTGPIVQMRHEKMLRLGRVSIDTFRRSRKVEISAHVSSEKLDAMHDAFAEHDTVVVEGVVRSTPNGLFIDSPVALHKLAAEQLH